MKNQSESKKTFLENVTGSRNLVAIPFILGGSCFVTYMIIGSKVAKDGLLIEPFFLIPIGYLFLAIGVIGFVISKRSLSKNKSK